MSQPTTPVFSVTTLLQELAGQLRGYAKDVGTSCSLPNDGDGCDALTLGVRCAKCARRVCPGHTFWKLAPKPVPYCPYCVLAENSTLFKPDDDEDNR